MDENVQTAVYFSDKMNGHQNSINFQELEAYLNKIPEVVQTWYLPEFSKSNLKKVASQVKKNQLNRIVIAGEMPGLAKDFITQALILSGNDPDNVILADFKEHGAITNADTERAKAIITCAVHGVSFETAAMPEEITVNSETLVIGGGIAGIQAALEIADSNHKVYLVERESTIGGHMAMFDKTFPTLDCAACILTPKMVDVGQHKNIELLSYSEVEDITGTPGNYKVKIKKKARYVNNNCTGCGECENACPVTNIPQIQLPSEYSKNIKTPEIEKLDKIFNKYGHCNNGSPDEHMLIQMMQDINLEYRYLPEYSLKYLSEILKVPLSQVYHVATFYTAFSLTPRGEHLIKVCMGTACHIRGTPLILERIESILDIKPDGTTEDGKFTLQTVGCLGCCALGPVVNVDDDYHQMSLSKIEKMIDHYYKKSK
ncbi:hypothetical protein ES705_15817 [subsurface metagenome]